MKSYKGNRFSFCCALFTEADASEAVTVLETLQRQRIRCAVPKRRSADCIARAATVLLFLSPDAVRDKAVLKGVDRAVSAGKTVLSVFLKETQLTPGLAMQLGQTQGILKYLEESDEAFYAKLLKAPALQSMSVTPQQKKALRRHALGWAIGGTLVLAAGLLLALNWRPLKAMLPTSPLRKIGAALDFDSIETLYVYGETKLDGYTAPRYRLFADGEHDWVQIDDRLIPQGDIRILDDFSLLHNLTQFCVCNNAIESIRPILSLNRLTLLDVSHNQITELGGIGALSELETLNVSYNPITSLDGISDLKSLRVLNLSHTDLSSLDALLSLPALETVYLDSAMRTQANLLGETPFAIEYTDTPVYDFEELSEALSDPSVTEIRIMSSLRIPEGAEITIPAGVAVTDIMRSRYSYISNFGTVRVFGVWNAEYFERNNYGTVIVERGGVYTGEACTTYSNGTFRIAEGGRQNLQPGATFYLLGGTYENNGDVHLKNGFRLRYYKGILVNNGSLYLYSLDLGNLETEVPIEQMYNSGTVYLNGFPILNASKASDPQ